MSCAYNFAVHDYKTQEIEMQDIVMSSLDINKQRMNIDALKFKGVYLKENGYNLKMEDE